MNQASAFFIGSFHINTTHILTILVYLRKLSKPALDHSTPQTYPTIRLSLSSSSLQYPRQTFIMPLIDPVTMSKSGGASQNDWMSKLMGKKLGESNDQMSFPKKDLPQNQ